MSYSDYQDDTFSLSQFINENQLSQFSIEEENDFISGNTPKSTHDLIDRQSNIISFTGEKSKGEDIFNIFIDNKESVDTTETDKKKIYYISPQKKQFIVNKKSMKKGSKRGRKSHKKNIDAKKKSHDKNSPDNLLRKIQIHYLTFIISFMNEIFQFFNIKQRLRNLDYKFKSNVNKKNVEYLKTANIRDIICHEISAKYKRKKDINNKSVCDKIDNKVLEKILAENYLILFRKFYYNECNIINLKEYGLDKNIILSDKVKLFKDFRENNEYRIKIDEFVIKHFFSPKFNVKKKLKKHIK